jgi:hypothetical protein
MNMGVEIFGNTVYAQSADIIPQSRIIHANFTGRMGGIPADSYQDYANQDYANQNDAVNV